MQPAEVTLYQVDSMDMLSASILVLFLGIYLNRRIPVLERNYIPPAVTGGLVFGLFATCLYAFARIELAFDMRFRDLLLLVFFSTVGLSARLSGLLRGGRALLGMIALAALFLVIQNGVGVGLAKLFGRAPAYGLMAGSVSLAGGHGTAAAWGAQAEAAGYANASAVGLVFATLGLIAGGVLGGPLARKLIQKNALRGPKEENAEVESVEPSKMKRHMLIDDYPLFPVLRTLLVLAICASLGDAVNRFLFKQGLLLPGFLTSMLVAIVLTNSFDLLGRPLEPKMINAFGDVSLQIFLTMSMMSMQLWHLAAAAGVVTVVLIIQVVVALLFSALIVFRLMGKDYDAVVLAAGFTGLGLGATPVAIANMEAVTRHYGMSTKGFVVIPLLGAFFIDLLNAGVIKLFIGLFI